MSTDAWLYLGSIVGIAVGIGLAVLAELRHRPVLALPALLPVGAGLVIHAGNLTVPAPAHAWRVVLAGALAVLAVVAGSPLTIWVLRRTEPSSTTAGPTGGIIVGGRRDAESEILRGGTTIGYLERLAVLGAAAVGRLEIVAAVIAVKGLGRFSELSSAVARERFIIGTLVSLLWAGTCGALIWPI